MTVSASTRAGRLLLTEAAATLVRLCAGRSPDLTAITLTGATPDAYLMFA